MLHETSSQIINIHSTSVQNQVSELLWDLWILKNSKDL
jgi:hypothetical protein